MSTLYYTPPTDEIFNEVKQKAIEVWQTYDNTNGYVDEKVNRIKDIGNVGDNLMYMVAMFDIVNQKKLADLLSYEAIKAIDERLTSGGLPANLSPFSTFFDGVDTFGF